LKPLKGPPEGVFSTAEALRMRTAVAREML
jgi:hypothetical protein